MWADRGWWPVFFGWLVVLAGSAVPVQATEPAGAGPVLEIAVLPYVSLSEIIKAYGPLAQYLEFCRST